MISAVKTASKNQRSRARGKPFVSGQSGNPKGRPPGSRNKATLLLEAISDSDLEAILAKVIDKAKAGDLTAAKLLWDRLAPAPKSRVIPIELPTIGEWDGNATVLLAYREILDGVARGDLSSEEATQLVALIEAQRSAVKELRPEAMHPKPTPEQLAERKRQAEEWKRIDEKIAKKFKPLWED